MIRNYLLLIFLAFLGKQSFAQNAISIPDTLSGSAFTLSMHKDSVQFFPGKKTQTLGFNQYSYLGPTLILNKGQNISITVNNNISDTTNVHWHGLHVSPSNDGGPHTMIMNGMSWNPQFNILNKASTFWYHPHFHGKTAEQAIKGAAGLIIVRDSIEATLNIPRSYGVDDFPIIVQCAEFDSLNQLMPRGMQDSVLLVNGKRTNNGQSAYLNVPAQVVRLRLLNASGERTFNFGFTNNRNFKIIGSDGGLLNAPFNTTRIRISPGERYEILLDLSGMSGQSLYLMSYASELATGIQGGPTMPMPPGNPPMNSPLNGVNFNILQLNVISQTSNPITAFPNNLVQVNTIPSSQSNRTRVIDMTAINQMSMDGPFYFNGKLFDMDSINYIIPLDDTEIWEIKNSTMVAHPFHIHDVQFNILDRDGNLPPVNERAFKDVVLIKPQETVRFITKFETFTDTVLPYVYHCHVLMHEDDGMMGQFLVVPQNYTGINNSMQLTKSLKIYPNPTTDYFNFELPNNTNFDLRIFDMTGKLVKSINSQSNTSIDITSLTPNNYVVFIRTKDGFYSSKLLIERK
jgi:bilirubin oxidase